MQTKHNLILDIETSTQWSDDGRTDSTPYHPNNFIVSIGWIAFDDEYNKIDEQYIFHDDPEFKNKLQTTLDQTKLFIGHNAKFDLNWLKQCGFKYDGPVFDTMIAEYLLARGIKWQLSLEACCIRRGIQEKKKDLTKDYWAKKIGLDKMPRDVVTEYGIGDVESTFQLYVAQKEIYSRPRNVGLIPTLEMSNEFLLMLLEVEANGIYINSAALDVIERDYIREKQELIREIDSICVQLLGDTSYNLASPQQLSELIYSRRVVNKDLWKKEFNIGLDEKGKPFRRPRLKPNELKERILANTIILHRTVASQCSSCNGTGRTHKLTKSGQPYKNLPRCTECTGIGICYSSTGKVAGLGLGPRSVRDLTNSGFSTDKEMLLYLSELPKTPSIGKRLLKGLIRLNAVETYLSSFVGGIRRATRANKILHFNLNQCITATGRLSSSDPNFQNQPRGLTFPVKRAIRSRFVGGHIAEIDFSQLEFRIAAELAHCPVMEKEIKDGVDVHRFTAATLTNAGQPTTRQEAKPKCFPLNTEILTSDGWKKYDQLKVGDIAITYNSNTHVLENDTILDIIGPHKQPIIRMRNKHNWQIDSTPEHRWFGYKRVDHGNKGRQNEYREFLTKDINSESRIITSSVYNSEGHVSVEDAARLAWLWTDGSITVSPFSGKTSQGKDGRRQGIQACIVQKKYVDEVDELFGVEIKKEKDKNGCYVWRLPAQWVRDLYTRCNVSLNDTDYSKFVLSLSTTAREAFLDAVCLAEGTKRNHNEWRIAQNAGPKAEAFKLAGFLCGYDVRIGRSVSKWWSKKVQERICLRTRNYVTGNRITKEELGEQDVWCAQTNNTSLVIRQNDTMIISGNTFRPLYGGKSGTPAEIEYNKAFMGKYTGLQAWHDELLSTACFTHYITLPSGREFHFPNAKKQYSGYVENETQIKNFPVQAVATADIVPIACILLSRYFKEHNVKSLIINTVHDSIITDIYPGEEELVISLMIKACMSVKKEFFKRYGYQITIPLGVEVKMGKTWLSMVPVKEVDEAKGDW